jgi:hypothetical protein
LDLDMGDALRRRFLELLADHAFCPCLRAVRFGIAIDDDVDAALEARRQKRDANAAAPAAALQDV